MRYVEKYTGVENPWQEELTNIWQSVARLWRFTGGRINDKIFHYDVGGEW